MSDEQKIDEPTPVVPATKSAAQVAYEAFSDATDVGQSFKHPAWDKVPAIVKAGWEAAAAALAGSSLQPASSTPDMGDGHPPFHATELKTDDHPDFDPTNVATGEKPPE